MSNNFSESHFQFRMPNGRIRYIERSLLAVLHDRYDAARVYQENKGVRFELTFEQFVLLVTDSRLNTIRNAMKKNVVDYFFRSRRGYVLSWKDAEAMRSGVMNSQTAAYINRAESRKVGHFIKGDKHSDASKQKISTAKKGTKHSEVTRERMAAAKRGTTRSEETKAKIRAAMLARKAQK